jgi:hypothetical protein
LNTSAPAIRDKERQANPSRRQLAGAVVKATIAPGLLALDFWKTGSERYRHWLLSLFLAVLGFVALTDRSGDAGRHLMAVEFVYANMPFGVFLEELWRILTFQLTESGTKDVYKHVVSWFFGSVLDMPQLFFPFIATVYGYFFAGSVLHVFRHLELSRVNYVLLGLIAIFLFLRGIDAFFTVRTWTGMWILVYACLKYYERPRLRFLLMMFLPPFIHLGFFLLAIPAWIVLVFGSRPLLYTIIFAVSSVTTVLPVEEVTQQLAQTERGEAQVQGYYQDEQDSAVEEFMSFREQTNWYNAYRRSGLQRWAPTTLVITLLASGFYFSRMTRYQRRIFSIGLLTLAFSNMTWFLFAVHNRSLEIATIFLLAAFLMTRLDPRTRRNFLNLPGYYKGGLHLTLLLFFPLLIFKLSVTSERFGFLSLIFPFLAVLFPEANISFKEAINALLGRG